MANVSIYVPAADLPAAEAEIHLWLSERGLPDARVVVEPNGGTGRWKDKLTIFGLAADLDALQVAETALVNRLDMAADIDARTQKDFDRYREYLEASATAEAKARSRLPMCYDESGWRTDISSKERFLVAGAALPDPRVTIDVESGVPVFVGPRMGVRYERATVGWFNTTEIPARLSADYIQQLGWATGELRYRDVSALWLHRAIPQPAGTLISMLNDDGWAATDAPDMVWHLTGLDCMPPTLNRYIPFRLDDLIGWAVDQWEAEFVLNAGNRLLRKSRLSFYVDYEPSDLNPGWQPHSGVGAFTGWLVSSEPEVTAEPLGDNNAEFREELSTIQAVLGRIGRTGLEWAVAHDAIVGGALEPDLDASLRIFIGLLIVDLILARAGYLTRSDQKFSGDKIEAIPSGAEIAHTEFVVTGMTLLDARESVYAFAANAGIPVSVRVYRAADRRRPERYPPDAIRVEVETLATAVAFDTLRRLAAVLGVGGEWRARAADQSWPTRIVEPQ